MDGKDLREQKLRDMELREQELREQELRDMALRDKIYDIIMDVAHSSQLHTLAKSDNQKKAFEMKMEEAVEELFELLSGQQLVEQRMVELPMEDPTPQKQPNPQEPSLREFTVDELARFDGSQGNPAYVGVNGNVYDVTKNNHWAGGTHFGLNAGQNHTNDFMVCHSGMVQILEGLTVIGKMV